MAGMTKQAMSQLVQELEAQGYVARTADPTDGRAVAIQPGSEALPRAHRLEVVCLKNTS